MTVTLRWHYSSFVIFQEIRTSIAKDPIFLFFRGWSGPPVPASGSAHTLTYTPNWEQCRFVVGLHCMGKKQLYDVKHNQNQVHELGTGFPQPDDVLYSTKLPFTASVFFGSYSAGGRYQFIVGVA